MATFLEGTNLNLELEKLILNAERKIVLVSPYIKLSSTFSSALKTKMKSPKVKLTIVFGKNADDPSKSFKEDDVDFFRNFPNVEILYNERLHAKYYANESVAIITSMNLYVPRNDSNLEAGVKIKSTVFDKITKNVLNEDMLDVKANKFFNRVIAESKMIFKKSPRFDEGVLRIRKKFCESVVEVDNLLEIFPSKQGEKISVANSQNPQIKDLDTSTFNKDLGKGYCIRTGIEITFDLHKPFSVEAYKSWSKYKNKEYPEKFCHFSGEPSDGETCFSRPILNKNWKKAKAVHKF